MHLDPDAIDGDAQRTQQGGQGQRQVRLRIDGLGEIVVQIETRPRVGFVGEAERHRDVVRPDAAQPQVVAQAEAVIGDDFVDDVPLLDPTAVVPDDGGDVVVQDLNQLVAREGAVGEPLRILGVPDQRVTAHHHVMGLGERDDLVAAREVVPIPFGMDWPPLHGVLGRHARILTSGGCEVLGVGVELGRAHRGSDLEVMLLCESPEGRAGRDRSSRRSDRGDRRQGQADRSRAELQCPTHQRSSAASRYAGVSPPPCTRRLAPETYAASGDAR